MALPVLARAIGGSLIKGAAKGSKKKITSGMIASGGGSNDDGGGRGGALVAKPSTSLVPKVVTSSAIVKAPEAKVTSAPLSMEGILLVIRKDVSFIESFLNFDLTNKQTKLAGLKQDQSKKRMQKEEKVSKSGLKNKKFGLKLPKSGLVDGVKNFIGNMLMGMFVLKMMDFLKGKNITGILKTAGKAVDFIIGVGGTLLNGLATFIDWGYKAYDATLGFIEKFGGQGAVDNFEKFAGLIDTALFLTTTIAGSMALEAMTGGGGGPGDMIQDRLMDQARKRLFQKGAAKAATTATTTGSGTAGGAGTATSIGAASAAAIIAGVGLLASALGEGSFQVKKASQGFEKKVYEFGEGAKKDPNPFTQTLKLATAAFVMPFLRFGNWLLNGIGVTLDIIGAPFRYAIELIRYPFLSEEDKEKQATNLAKFDARIRDGIREHFAGFLSPLLKLIGQGDMAKALDKKGALGSMFGEKGTKGMGYRGGGKAKAPGSTTKKKKRGLRKLPQKPTYSKEPLPKSGESLGVSDVQSEKAWWDPAGVFTGKKTEKEIRASADVSRRIVSVQNKVGEDQYFGPILTITSKLIRGQKPDFKDYQNVGLGINLLYQDGVKEGVIGDMPTRKYSSGGSVKSGVSLGDISKWVQTTFEDKLRSKIRDAITLNVPETVGTSPKPATNPSQEIPTSVTQGSTYATTSSGEYGDILNLIASVEAKSYDTINGGHIDGLSTMTIAGARSAAMNAGYGSGAMGRYQQMPQFVLDRAISIGLDPNKDLFSPENQDKLAILLIDGAGYRKWKAGELTTEKFAYRLAGTWRGLPEGPSNLTYQDQYASGNKAHTTWDNVMKVLGGSKRSGSVATGNVTVPQLSAGAPATTSTSGSAGDGSIPGKTKKGGIYLHWSAGGGFDPYSNRYHRTVLADGSVVGDADLNVFDAGHHTAYRNNRGVGLAIAAMESWNWSTLKPIQLEKLAETAAAVAKSMGYSAADINVKNIATHAEVGSMKDGVRNPAGPNGNPDNYGPTMWGGDSNKLDLLDLNKADYDKGLGQGGPKLRAMILQKFKAMKQGGYIGKYDKSMKSIEGFAPYESGAEQFVMVPLPSQGQSMPMMDATPPNTSLPVTVFADDQFEFLDYQG